jgi:hypothetical protein
VVYAKPSFGGPAQVVEYLGRYTHKVAISNNRIKSISAEGEVTFSYKDYADGSKQKDMELPAPEFIRRFEQHILPKGFTEIRHYGYLSNLRTQHAHSGYIETIKTAITQTGYQLPLRNIYACTLRGKCA